MANLEDDVIGMMEEVGRPSIELLSAPMARAQRVSSFWLARFG